MQVLPKTNESTETDSLLEQRIAELEDKLAEQANKFSDISRIGTVITSINCAIKFNFSEMRTINFVSG